MSIYYIVCKLHLLSDLCYTVHTTPQTIVRLRSHVSEVLALTKPSVASLRSVHFFFFFFCYYRNTVPYMTSQVVRLQVSTRTEDMHASQSKQIIYKWYNMSYVCGGWTLFGRYQHKYTVQRNLHFDGCYSHQFIGQFIILVSPHINFPDGYGTWVSFQYQLNSPFTSFTNTKALTTHVHRCSFYLKCYLGIMWYLS